MKPTLAATAKIDLAALRHNLEQIKLKVPNSQITSIVKANGYGHGAVPVALALASLSDNFGVARIEEALELRRAGISQSILLLEGFYADSDLPILQANNLHTALHCEEQLVALEQASLASPIHVWLKIDTGMHRLGIRPEDLNEFIDRLHACPNVVKPLRFISHFGCADELDNPVTMQQITLFTQLAEPECERSIAASSGILAWPDSHLEWVRPGIILYGVSPFENQTAESLGFKPAMTLTSQLIAVRDVKSGESVGYGATWTAQQDTKVGVIAMGYGDGYPRTAPNGTPVLINGRRVPLVGRVSMDMLTVELGADSQDEVGDEATLWGNGLPAEEVAHHIGMIAYELVTKLTGRVALLYSE
ncbi:alanine racemase [Vibrio sp.]|uniref:alanine racemase n=1 Tax=Vibrio sp. TaxID=678 RepID=UPI003AA7F1DF